MKQIIEMGAFWVWLILGEASSEAMKNTNCGSNPHGPPFFSPCHTWKAVFIPHLLILIYVPQNYDNS